MTQVIKIDIITGHEEMGKFAFYSVDYISFNIYRKTMHVLKNCINNYESIAYCLTKFCLNIYFWNHEINEGDNLYKLTS